jgi:hypothetical protein
MTCKEEKFMEEMHDTTTLCSESKGRSHISYFHILYKAKDIYSSSASRGNARHHLHTMTRHFVLLCDTHRMSHCVAHMLILISTLCAFSFAGGYFDNSCFSCLLGAMSANIFE